MTIDLFLFAALSQREWFLLGICAVIYATLFVVALQNSRRKMLILRQRFERVQQLQQEKSQANIQQNQQRLVELQGLIQKLGDENSMLRLELEEKEARLTYNNKVAALENERRSKAESLLFASPVYLRLQDAIQHDDSMTATDIDDLARVIDELYDGFTATLLGLCKMNSHERNVCLLIKARFAPKDIATLTAHSKESIATTRSRLYQKVFAKKGSTKDWDDFVLSL